MFGGGAFHGPGVLGECYNAVGGAVTAMSLQALLGHSDPEGGRTAHALVPV